MLQFAQKFYKDNPDSVFSSADAAYTLSYLMMMAQTELHNPQVEKPMTFDQFKKLAKVFKILPKTRESMITLTCLPNICNNYTKVLEENLWHYTKKKRLDCISII